MPSPLSKINILLIEDKSTWVRIVERDLRLCLSDYSEIEFADSYETAKKFLAEKSFHLITLDLAIKGLPGKKFPGNSLFDVIRENGSINADAGLVVITNYGTEENLINAMGTKYRVEAFIIKQRYKTQSFTEAARRAIFDSVTRRARKRHDVRTSLSLSIDAKGHIWEGDLRGPAVQARCSLKPTINLGAAKLITEADSLELEILSNSKARWRSKAKKIGAQIYQSLTAQPQVRGLLTSAMHESKQQNTCVNLRFTSPAKYLNLPLELLFNSDYLVFENIFIRQLVGTESDPTTFLRFVSGLHEKKLPLKAIVIGANLDDAAMKCENEVRAIRDLLERNFEMLGLTGSVKVLAGAEDATYERLAYELESECHILHFAGHSDNRKTIPENSEIQLYDRAIKAIDLKSLLKNRNTQLVFLNSCLGARMGDRTGRGGYWGFMDALASAGVPAILGFRWSVEDITAEVLSRYFYELLFRTFCPAEALFFARKKASIEVGRDEDIWASIVLLMQNL